MLYAALGFFASRDNVWTTAANVTQAGCNGECVEAAPHADNAVALLAGGPYGFSDAVGLTDRAMVLRASRSDGVLLRPGLTLATLDAKYTALPPDPLAGAEVWAAHDEHAGLRWSYVLAFALASPVQLGRRHLQQPGAHPWVAYRVALGARPAAVVRIDAAGRLAVPAVNGTSNALGLAHWATAPVLPSGLALLGDVARWAPMSSRRFRRLSADANALTAKVLGSPGEVVAVSFVPAGSLAIRTTQCTFPQHGDAACAAPDAHGDVDCTRTLECTASSCSCSV